MTLQDAPAPGMGQCSVTGKIVPEDELVTISGQRVCAEGKAILLERLKAGEAMPGELEKPTVLRRFGCMFVDVLVIGVPVGILMAVVGMGQPGAMVIGLMTVFAAVLQIVYFGQLHGTRGQSVGKMAGKLVVVNMDGSPISLKTGYIRAVAYVGPNLLNGVAMLTGAVALIQGTTGIVYIYGIVNVIVALVDGTSQRAIHDRIAGTRVVEKN